MFSRKSGAAPKPAWALILRSPFTQTKPIHSWLGGVPIVPIGFDWPRGEDGRPLHFAAQINLSALQLPDGYTQWPKAIPNDGVLLAFTGATVFLSPDKMSRAVQLNPPADIPSLSDVGFFGKGHGFTYWPIDPIPYMSHPVEVLTDENARPDVFPKRLQRPEDYITSAGIAALDAEITLAALISIDSSAVQFFKTTKRPRIEKPNDSVQRVLRSKIERKA